MISLLQGSKITRKEITRCAGKLQVHLKDGGKLHTDSMEKAEILSNQFKSVFTQEDTTVIPHLHGPDYPTISNLEVTPIGVTKLLNGINPKKAQGPDEIPFRILRELDNELTPALTAIFNQSENR